MYLCLYLAVAPVFGAPDESRNNLSCTALGALVGISNQTLHMRLEKWQERIIKVPEKTLLQYQTFFVRFQVLYIKKCLLNVAFNIKHSYLEEAKSTWAEFIIPFPVLQRQILDELIYETHICEVIVYDLFTLQKNKHTKNWTRRLEGPESYWRNRCWV